MEEQALIRWFCPACNSWQRTTFERAGAFYRATCPKGHTKLVDPQKPADDFPDSEDQNE